MRVLIYSAGLFDGEGSVHVARKKDKRPAINKRSDSYHYRIRVKVTNTHKGVLLFLKRNFGGSVRPIPKKKRHKQAWLWTIWSHNVFGFLVGIYPYLIIKKKVARNAIRLQSLLSKRESVCGSSPVSQEEEVLRTRLWSEIRSLNKRGDTKEV